MKRLLLIIPCLFIAGMVNAQQEPVISDSTFSEGFNDSELPRDETNYNYGWYVNHYPYDTSGHQAFQNSELVVNCEGADTAQQAGIGTYGSFWNPATSAGDTIDISGSKKAMMVITNHSDTADAHINFNVQAVVSGVTYNANPRTTGVVSISPNTTDTLVYRFYDAYDYGQSFQVTELDSVVNFFTAVNLEPSSQNNDYTLFNDTISIDTIQIGGITTSAPTNVSASAQSDSSISVNWDQPNAIAKADTFLVRNTTNGDSVWAATAGSVTFDTLSADTQYDFVVEAYDKGADQYYASNSVSATTQKVGAGIFSSSFSSDVTVYPNPASDVINVEGVEGDVSTTVSNQVGQVVATGDETVDVSSLSPGVYVVTVQSNGEVSKAKVLVE